MGKSENFIKFEEAMEKNPEMQKEYEDNLKKIIETKTAKSVGEAIYLAVKEMGFDISMEELERNFADKQELEDDELDKEAGGGGGNPCWFNDGCFTVINHSGGQDKEEACWSDYNCVFVADENMQCVENFYNCSFSYVPSERF